MPAAGRRLLAGWAAWIAGRQQAGAGPTVRPWSVLDGGEQLLELVPHLPAVGHDVEHPALRAVVVKPYRGTDKDRLCLDHEGEGGPEAVRSIGAKKRPQRDQ
jgi:hypothetical protein